MASAKLGIGLIGTGKHGARYVRHILNDLPELQLVAIARRDAVKAAATGSELGVRAFTDYRELVRHDGVDAVVAVVPPTLHLDIVKCAAEAGRPLLLEKPAAPSLGEGRAMLDVLRSHPIPVMVAQTLRYNAVVRALAAELQSIGPIHALDLSQRFEPSPLPWLDEPAISGGGITLHTGIHLFDLMRVLTGLEADSVTCQMDRVHTRNTEDSFAATVRLGGGAALATVSCARTAGGRGGHVELSGERGTLIGDHVLHHAGRAVGTRMEQLALGMPAATVREVLADFARAVRSGSPMPVPLEEGLRAVAVADACYAAARSGSATPVPRVETSDRVISY